METSGEGNDLEERYINVHRGGKRQAPPARKPQGRPRRDHIDYDDEFYDDPYYDDYDRGGYGGYDDDYDYDYDPPPRKKSGHSGSRTISASHCLRERLCRILRIIRTKISARSMRRRILTVSSTLAIF